MAKVIKKWRCFQLMYLVNIVKSVYTWRYGPWAHHFENKCKMKPYHNVAVIACDTCISFMWSLADC